MNAIHLICGVVVFLLCAYLFAALLKPELF